MSPRRTGFPIRWTEGALERWAARNGCEVCEEVGTMVLEWRPLGGREHPFFVCTACQQDRNRGRETTTLYGRLV